MPHNYPFCVESTCVGHLQLVREAGQTFRCWRDGEVPELLSGPDFLLASRALATELERSSPQGLKVLATTVHAAPDGLAADHFVELLLTNEIRPDCVGELEVTGSQVWHYNHSSLFVSPLLASSLKHGPFSGKLALSVGFSRFAGEA